MRYFLSHILPVIFLPVWLYAQPVKPPRGFEDKLIAIDSMQIHYIKGGSGKPLLLLHGFGENWYMWNRLLPDLATQFTVIAIDLPGIGGSSKSIYGYDKISMALAVHQLTTKQGYAKVYIAGHDIGMMIAYAYASKYRDEVDKLILMDAVLPGIEPEWSLSKTNKWWFGFFSRPAAPLILKDKVAIFFEDFWSIAMHIPKSFHLEEKKEFIQAYSTEVALNASMGWFNSFEKDETENTHLARNKLTMPVMTIAGEFGAARFLGPQAKKISENVTEIIIQNAGHWLVQEQPDKVKKCFIDFLSATNN